MSPAAPPKLLETFKQMEKKTAQIAVLDDEEDIVELLTGNLGEAGFKARGFTHPKDFMAYLEEHTPDLVVLDLMLPGESGLEICKRLKKAPATESIPILMLTAKTEEIDRILGFELGADDYMTKPFSTRELIARVKAILRRTSVEGRKNGVVLSVGDCLKIDTNKYKVFVDDKEVVLTTTEFRILTILTENREWVLSRQQILEKLWGNDKYVIDRTIDVHIRHLREKLGHAGRFVKNIRGVGYKVEV